MHSAAAGEARHCLSRLFLLAASQIVCGILTSGTIALPERIPGCSSCSGAGKKKHMNSHFKGNRNHVKSYSSELGIPSREYVSLTLMSLIKYIKGPTIFFFKEKKAFVWLPHKHERYFALI